MPHQIARLRLLGMLFCLAGGVAITIGWTGTAQVACVDCQVPYLISGGAGGLALTVIGTGLLVIAQLRVEGQRIAERLTTLAGPSGDGSSGDGSSGDGPPGDGPHSVEPEVETDPMRRGPDEPATLAG